MLLLLSPAKSLDFTTPPQVATHTQPLFVKQSTQLIKVLREKTPAQISDLMSLSDPLAGLNVARYQAWSPDFSAANARQAILAFNGDVYEGLQAQTLNSADLAWAQQHVAILSGLYGVLRPLDWMQPYRLEMGARLATAAGSNLYQFWGVQIAEHLNAQLQGAADPWVLNLASVEYAKAVDRKTLQARVVECVFEDWKSDQYKIIGFYAKRARGLMARHAITQRVRQPQQLQAFDAEGYAFDAHASAPDRLVFRRRTG